MLKGRLFARDGTTDDGLRADRVTDTMDRRTRLLVAVVLLAGTIGLCVHYGATYEEGWPYPTGQQLATDYERHVGETALVFGEVRALEDGGTVVVRAMHSPGELTTDLVVTDVDEAVRPGSTVQVYGRLEPDRRMDAEEVVVTHRDRGYRDTLYALGTSLVGIALAVGSVARYWRVNTRELSMEAR